MYDIKTISDTVNVSKTSIYNIIKKLDLETFKKDGKTFLDEIALNQIVAYYSLERQKSLKDIISNTDISKNNDIQVDFNEVEYLKEQNKDKDNEIELHIQDKFKIEIDQKAEYIGFLKMQLDEKEKTIQSLIQSFNYDKQYQTARIISENNKNTQKKESFFKRILTGLRV